MLFQFGESSIFVGPKDNLLASPDQSGVGTGLAIGYWFGFLKFKTLPEKDEDNDTSKFEMKAPFFAELFVTIMFSVAQTIGDLQSQGFDFEVNKLLILVPFSCNFEKDKERWPQMYHLVNIDNSVSTTT